MKIIRIGQFEKTIIKNIASGLLLGAALLVPGILPALKPLFKNNKRYNIRRAIQSLESKNIIILGGEQVLLTKKGQEILAKINIEEIEIKKPEEWDKIWRFVAYDIPDDYKKQRDYFRYKLKNLGFAKIQKSLWLYPYECREEIAVLAQSLKLSPYIIYLTTDYIPQQDRMMRKFNLSP